MNIYSLIQNMISTLDVNQECDGISARKFLIELFRLPLWSQFKVRPWRHN